MRIAPEIGDVTIVLLGSFNPPIVRPDWFAKHDLVDERLAEAAEIEVIHREITIFRMEWLSVRVQTDRFVAETSEAPFVRVQDLVVKTFHDLLPHTPVWAMGINRRVHFRVPSDDARNELARRLAPLDAWGEWGEEIRQEFEQPPRPNRGGLVSLTMRQGTLTDRAKGSINAKIEPSSRLPGPTGVYIEINDHYEVAERANAQDATELIDLLQQRFEASVQRSEWIIDQVMALV